MRRNVDTAPQAVGVNMQDVLLGSTWGGTIGALCVGGGEGLGWLCHPGAGWGLCCFMVVEGTLGFTHGETIAGCGGENDLVVAFDVVVF